MITRISNEQPFQVLTSAFSISPSQSGYNLEISADGVNYSPLFTVGAGVTRLVTGVAANSFYRLKGNTSDVVINWQKTCVTEGGGGNAGELEPVTEFPLGAQEGTVVALVSGNTAGVYQYDGEDWIPVGVDDLSNYYTKSETDAEISAATSPIQEQLDDVERVTASALTELHQDILDLSGATSNYYTKNETDTQIADAIASIPQPDLSNYYTKNEIGIKEEVVSRALNDLHNDVLDLSASTPDMSSYYTKAETDAEITGATSDMKTYTDNRLDGYNSASTITVDGAYWDDYCLYFSLSDTGEYGPNIPFHRAALGSKQYAVADFNERSLSDFIGKYLIGINQGASSESETLQMAANLSGNAPITDSNYGTVEIPFVQSSTVISHHQINFSTASPRYFILDRSTMVGRFADNLSINQFIPGVVKSDGVITKVKKLTQAEYDAITTPDAGTLYIIINN